MHLLDRRAVYLRLRLAAGDWPQLRGDLHDDRHQTVTALDTPAWKASTVGSIVWVSNVPRTGSMSPRSASLARTAVVTPPAVSVKMPVVCASNAMPARISSSLTASTEPPVRRARSSA